MCFSHQTKRAIHHGEVWQSSTPRRVSRPPCSRRRNLASRHQLPSTPWDCQICLITLGGLGGVNVSILYIYIYYYCIQYYPCNSGFSSLAGSVLEPWAVSQPKDTKRPNGKLIGTAWHQRACDRMLRTSCSKVISRTSGCLIFSIFQLFEKFLAGGFINIGRCMNGHQGHKQSVGCHERQGTSP